MTFKKNTPCQGSFADIAIEKKLADVDSFLLHVDKIVDFKKLSPTLKKNGIGVTDATGRPSYDGSISK